MRGVMRLNPGRSNKYYVGPWRSARRRPLTRRGRSELVWATMRVVRVVCPQSLTTVGTRALLTTHRQLQRLVIKAARSGPPEEDSRAVFDLSQCTDIDPACILLFVYTSRVLHRMGWSTFIEQGTAGSPAFAALLKQFQHLKAQRAKRQSQPWDPGQYPLRGVKSQKDMVAELQEWAECVRKATTASEEDLARWTTHVSELTTNSFQHAPTGFSGAIGDILIAGEAKEGLIQLATLDTGSGIPSVLRPHVPPALHDGEIIARACQERVTSRCSRANQGLGLYALSEAVKAARGTLQILSGNGLSHVRNGRNYARCLKPSPSIATSLAGTLTVIGLTVTGLKTRRR